MSKYGRDVDAIYRDILVALAHPDYADTPTIEALRDLKRRRRDA